MLNSPAFLILLLSVAFTGCGSNPPVVLDNEIPDQEPMSGMSEVPSFDYLVGPGDVVRVNVFRHPELSSSVYKNNTPGSPVSSGGMISLPLVGEVIASGRTVFDIRDQVQDLLKVYLRDPRVDISVVEHNAHRFYVFGEVKKPGMFVMDRPLSALKGLSLAGGYTNDANRNYVALIRGPIAEENIILFDTLDLDPIAGTYLRSGDILFVTQREWATVAQAARDLVPLLQLISLPIGTARDVALIEDIRRN